MMIRGATPRSYSCTPSSTRASCRGVGFPSESAGEPRMTIASNRVRAVFEVGARALATAAHTNTTATAIHAPVSTRPRQLIRRRGATYLWCRARRVAFCLCIGRGGFSLGKMNSLIFHSTVKARAESSFHVDSCGTRPSAQFGGLTPRPKHHLTQRLPCPRRRL